jgi:hypothetical protein
MKTTPKIALCLLLLTFILAAPAAFAQNPPEKQPLVITWDKDNPGCDQIFIEGMKYRIIKHDGLTVVANIFEEKDYLIAHVGVFNGSKDRVLVSPEASSLTVWKDAKKQDATETFAPIPAEKVAQKVANRGRWARALMAFGGATATTTQTTTESGSVIATGPGGTATGTYSGSSTTTVPDYEARRRAERATADSAARAGARADAVMGAALRANTVFPDKNVIGEIYFQRKKFELGYFALRIGDVSYNFVLLTQPRK